ncbi:MAG: hypothetical protein WAT70_06745 [Rhizobiaceae bacterium]
MKRSGWSAARKLGLRDPSPVRLQVSGMASHGADGEDCHHGNCSAGKAKLLD